MTSERRGRDAHLRTAGELVGDHARTRSGRHWRARARRRTQKRATLAGQPQRQAHVIRHAGQGISVASGKTKAVSTVSASLRNASASTPPLLIAISPTTRPQQRALAAARGPER